jgi:UDP-glucose 4-epimerase
VTKERIVVTGGSGELGTLVLRKLCADRHVADVVAFDVRPPMACGARLRAVTGDVRDEDALMRAMQGADAVVHLAFVMAALRPRAEMDAVNVDGSKNVFRCALRSGVKRIVYTSSVAAYGVVPGHPVPLVESSPRVRQPTFAYACNKFDVEAFLDELEREHPHVPIARLRPGIVLGRGMEHPLGDLMRRRLILDSGTTPLAVVWDEDVADAIVLALKAGARGAFNVAAEEAATAAELAAAARMRLVAVPRAVLAGARLASRALAATGALRAFDPSWLDALGVAIVPSSARARAELGWKPRAPTARDVVRRYADTVPRALDRRIDVFMRLVAFGARHGAMPEEGRHMTARVHLDLTGPRGGDFAMILENGALRVERGIPRPPGTRVVLSADTFLDLLAGRVDMTTAGMTGKVRVEGEGLASFLFQAMFTTFRARTDFVSARLKRWFARGGGGDARKGASA